MSDPTGTAMLRRSFLAEANRRLARLRSLTHTVLVEHDMMAARNDPMAALLGQPGHRLGTFVQWFERTADEQLAGAPWWEPFLQRAYQSGADAGDELVGSRPPRSLAPVPAVYRELAASEFAGIAAAMTQQVSRQAAAAAVGGRKPLPMYQRVLAVLRGVGQVRARAAVNTLTVQLHNAARLAAFRAAGVARVGVVPERPEPRRMSRFLRQFLRRDHLADAGVVWGGPGSRIGREETPSASTIGRIAKGYEQASELESVNVQTAEDDLVCQVCQDIADAGPYDVDEALSLIPAHPNCRCSFVPADDMRFAVNREMAAAEEDEG